MKFSQMKYTRPEFEPVNGKLMSLLQRFKDAKSSDEAFAAYKEADTYIQHVYSMFALAYIRNTLDTRDEFYDAERDYMDELGPKLMPVNMEFMTALIQSPFRKELEAAWGTLLFDKAEMELKTFKPEIVPDLQAENKLGSEYDKLMASAQIEFDGKTLTLAQLKPYHEDPDRSVREASLRAQTGWFMLHAEKLDSIFDELVKIRTRIAKTLGYENFVELGYYRKKRICYNIEKVEGFRKGVVDYIVPIATQLKAEQAKRIGVETIKIYDDPCEYLEGNAKPVGTADDIFTHGKKMYHELSSDTAEFIDFMLENELFDVLTRPGKSGGGYCSYIADHKSPFIFANFNGTSGDIDVLTHEAGHAFAAYEAREIYPSALSEYSSETAEVHSMSMEFFTWPWMEGFFGNQTKKYYKSHLGSALTFIPYGTMVDEFQHHIYQKPELSPKERNDLWLELEGKYRPYLDLAGFPFYGEGRRWQAQAHIYETPFYYIDYCLAEVVALAFWAEDQKDHGQAWAKYVRLTRLAGTKTFSDLLSGAGLPSPFVPETIKSIACAAIEWLESNN
ncbi:MAG: M3 family oligoendopeptidase [Defluviitaleaceae bacterium]|nr:M3 family oligoendopeptidase [Defluviitaleaceae bacterium]MCL2835348.1 M3 family oligoendopeptidase [Defluviitaleaceae bacterium]